MPALPASATQRQIEIEVERRKIIMAREAGRIFRRRADVRIRTGTSRITTSDACRYTTTTMRRCRFRRHRLITVGSRSTSNAGKIIVAREAGRIFRRKAGTTGLEPADLSPDKRLLLPLSYVPK